MKILVINGPNMNLLSIREPEHYGTESYSDLIEKIKAHCGKNGIEVSFFQSNHEGAIVDEIQNALGKFDAIVINPAAYTHTSIAILDALRAVGIPAAEVHISDIKSREPYRQISYVREYCEFSISGHGTDGYLKAIDHFIEKEKGNVK